MENENPKNKVDAEKTIDSPMNMPETQNGNGLKSLTDDEDSATNPNEVSDKATFGNNNENPADRSGRFDGNVGI